MAKATNGTPRNRVLAALPARDRRRLDLELVSLETRRLLFDVDRPISDVYFIEDGVASILGVSTDGSGVEVATVGFEGMVGLPVFLGSDRTNCHAFMQIPGRAYRLSSDALTTAIKESDALRTWLNRYTQALFMLVAQGSACNRLHTAKERCARWLLLTHDRVGRDEFPLTQDFLAQMIGIRRATVSAVNAELQGDGVIEYSRGMVRILDRKAMEREACECYAIIVSEFDRVFDGKGSRLGARSRNGNGGKSTIGPPRPRR